MLSEKKKGKLIYDLNGCLNNVIIDEKVNNLTQIAVKAKLMLFKIKYNPRIADLQKFEPSMAQSM